MLNFSLHLALKNFGVKLLLHLFTLSIAFLPQLSITYLLLNGYMVLLLLTPILKSLDVHVLLYCILMNTPNLNLMLVYVAFSTIVVNIKVFVVGILSVNNYVPLAMSPFANIVHFLVFPHFIHLYPSLNPSSLIPPLIYFPLVILSLTLSLTLPVSKHNQSNPESHPLLVFELNLSSSIDTLWNCHLLPVLNLNQHLFIDPPG